MAKIVYKNRLVGGYKYINCPNCNETVEIKKPIEIDMPYCSECKKVVLDASQVYCCWCGQKFEENQQTV